jgi:hypothetical protein
MYMKTRSNNDSGVAAYYAAKHKSAGTSGSPADVIVGISPNVSFEEFIDSASGKGMWHSCAHARRTRLRPYNTGTIYQNATYPYDARYIYWWDGILIGAESFYWCLLKNPDNDLGVPEYNTQVSPKRLAVYPSDDNGPPVVYFDESIQSECRKVMRDLLPGIRAKGQIPNDLVELRDFKSLPKTLRKVRGLAKKYRKFFDWRIFKRSINASSDSFLQWKFNVAPLMSDIKDTVLSLKRLDQRIQRLVANEKKFLVSHRKVDVRNHFPDGSKTIYATCYQGTLDRRATAQATRNVSYSTAVAHVTVDFAYDLSDYNTDRLRIAAFLDSLDFTWNPAIIWNAIRWTFVIDWLVGVSNFLNQFKKRNIEPRVIIYNSCFSLHLIRRCEYYYSWQCEIGGTTSGLSLREDEEVYTRIVNTLGLVDIVTTGLNSSEFIIASALAASKATKR